MANNRVEIHDPLSNNNLTSSTDCDTKSTSDTVSMANTVEYRLMMAYATRRRPKKDVEPPPQDGPVVPNGGTRANGPSSPQTLDKIDKDTKERRNKNKKGWKRLSSIMRCIKPRTEDEDPPRTLAPKPDVNNRCAKLNDDKVEEGDELEKLTSRLTEIADEIPFVPPELETDSNEDEVEKVIGLILREAGDRLNEKELKDAAIAKELFWNYSFFKKLITALLIKMGLMPPEPDALGPQASPKTQIAVTCEVTSRLSAINTLPMSRMLDHGARYLQEHYSSWAQQQGGYENAFHEDEDDDDDDDDVQ
ncbi:apoptosis facilitator Bcl-2-like protein 14 [Chaetodon trifascialis]|uniref:apoptosis facilitator Bcl-2-like protein 14 n=1 Tax=Chaetodon trifascialis TaxID=109706 RepID=UPI0039927764